MKKSYVVAVMLAVVFLGAIYVVISLLKKNEVVTYDSGYTWHVEFDTTANVDTLVRGKKINHIKNDVAKLVIALNKSVAMSEVARPREDATRRLPADQSAEHRKADREYRNHERPVPDAGHGLFGRPGLPGGGDLYADGKPRRKVGQFHLPGGRPCHARDVQQGELHVLQTRD